MNKIQENNQATISGKVVSDFTLDHEVYGEKFYLVNVLVMRLSKAYDVLPVIVSDRLINTSTFPVGSFVKIIGNFRSFNKQTVDGRRLILSIFAREFTLCEIERNENQIFIQGYICKAPVYRKTPFGREIGDMLVAVNRPYEKSDYIPCICWGRNARYVSMLNVGQLIKIYGRIQSREYIKKTCDEKSEARIAYEVSASRIEVLNEENRIETTEYSEL